MAIFDPETANQPVQDIFNPSIRGITTGKTRQVGTTLHVQIELGVNVKKYLPCENLEPTVSKTMGIEDLLESLKFGQLGDLARILTFHKISSNLSNIFYAMQASRTDFYSYQFKPVYKFIESLNGRMLIADEVGLGKTIEAGLIWLETKARQPDARRLLIICPSMLRDKWKEELKFRFETKAEIYDTHGFLELLEEFKNEGPTFECAAICSLQTIRQESIQEVLEHMEETPNRFDLVIIDEAHHMRNVETQSHRVGRLLSDVTHAMVLLTATPIHLKSEDLFRLLRILDPDEFSQIDIFQQRLQENQPIVEAQNLLRQKSPNPVAALEQIQLLDNSPWFTNSEMMKLVKKQLKVLTKENHAELIKVQRRLENLNLFSSIISRTRKREVQEKRVIRESNVLVLQFNNEEKDFYDAVTKAVQQRMASVAHSYISGFALMMPQRMMASCIPAMVEHYRQKSELDDELLEEVGILADDVEKIDQSELWLDLRGIIDKWDDNNTDSKFEKLLEALQNRFEREPNTKIIIFSFFKKTLGYLHRRLTAEGFTPLIIHGDVPMEERQKRIDIFKNNLSQRILLSSEVGSEGIDLQFCRIIINYDLPWNPMKVEQRIGRIDRIGQKADRITILNFAVTGTIEEKILNRLYERIGIFKQSLGNLEPILGEMTKKLHNDLLSQRLTPKQEEDRIIQTAQAFERRCQHEKELAEQSAVFLGSSDYILQQINRSRDLGRWITPKDLRSYIEDFFTESYRGTNIIWDEPQKGLVTLKLANNARNDLLYFCQSQSPPIKTRLTSGYPDSEILAYQPEIAQEKPGYELLMHFHPLIKWISDVHEQTKDAFFPTATVNLKTNTISNGIYLIAVQFWTFEGVRKDIQIAYAISSLNDQRQVSPQISESLIQEILDFGTSWEFADQILSQDQIMKAWEDCTTQLSVLNVEAFNQFKQESDEMMNRRQAHLEAFARRKRETVLKSIATLENKALNTSEEAEKRKIKSQIKGNQTKLNNQQIILQNRLGELENKSRVQNEFTDIAAVICQITN